MYPVSIPKPPASLTPGRILLSLAGALTTLSPFIFERHESQNDEPCPTPHLRNHNGATTSLSLLLGGLSLYYTWRPLPPLSMPPPAHTSPDKCCHSDTSPHPDTRSADAVFIAAQLAAVCEDLADIQGLECRRMAALLASLYWVAAVGAWLYPGSAVVDLGFGGGVRPGLASSGRDCWGGDGFLVGEGAGGPEGAGAEGEKVRGLR